MPPRPAPGLEAAQAALTGRRHGRVRTGAYARRPNISLSFDALPCSSPGVLSSSCRTMSPMSSPSPPDCETQARETRHRPLRTADWARLAGALVGLRRALAAESQVPAPASSQHGPPHCSPLSASASAWERSARSSASSCATSSARHPPHSPASPAASPWPWPCSPGTPTPGSCSSRPRERRACKFGRRGDIHLHMCNRRERGAPC